MPPKKKKAARSVVEAAPKPPTRKKAKKSPRIVIPSATDYLDALQKLKGVEKDDFAFMAQPTAWTSTVDEWLPTGCLALDRLIGGGYPVGRYTEVAAWEGIGKSTLLDQSIAQSQRDGAITALIDSEQARDESYTASLGVDLSKLIISKAETIEEAFLAIDRLVSIQEAHVAKLAPKKKRPPPMLIAWDSLAGTPTKNERDGAADDSHVADAARRVKLNFKRLQQRIAKARVALVFTNQFYQGIGAFASLNTYGGSGVRYGTSLRIWLSRKGSLRSGNEVVGHILEAKLKKTRIAKPRPPAEMGLIYGAGVHNAYTLFEWGKRHGTSESHRWIQQKGAWSYCMFPDGEYQAFQGTFMGFAEFLNEHPDIYAQMAEQYKNEG